MPSSGETARVFFALWPDSAAAARMSAIAQQWQGSLGGRITRTDTLHATLVFIGDVEITRVSTLLALADDIGLPGFDMVLDARGCWGHNRIAYLGAKQIPQALSSLQAELAARVRLAGFSIETRAYIPHITLIRKADCSKMPVEYPVNKNPADPVAWMVRDFVLVKSSICANGSRYEQIGRWPLLEDDATS